MWTLLIFHVVTLTGMVRLLLFASSVVLRTDNLRMLQLTSDGGKLHINAITKSVLNYAKIIQNCDKTCRDTIRLNNEQFVIHGTWTQIGLRIEPADHRERNQHYRNYRQKVQRRSRNFISAIVRFLSIGKQMAEFTRFVLSWPATNSIRSDIDKYIHHYYISGKLVPTIDTSQMLLD